jgi:hypothetical protein
MELSGAALKAARKSGKMGVKRDCGFARQRQQIVGIISHL